MATAFSVYERKDGTFDVSSSYTRGSMATVHGFDVSPRGIVTRYVNRHYWPSDVTDEMIRDTVAEKRRLSEKTEPAASPRM